MGKFWTLFAYHITIPNTYNAYLTRAMQYALYYDSAEAKLRTTAVLIYIIHIG